jgi:penicillin-binding protein 1A
MLKKWWQFLILFVVAGVLTISALSLLAFSLVYPSLPSLEALTDYKPKLPLRVYSADGYLISEFGEERRAFIKVDQVPKNLKDAVLAIEDRRFYQHGGIDTTGVIRAIKNNLTGKSHEGASTITMQVAKNFFTVPGGKRNMVTKVKEALLAIKIEKALNKDQILELYLNQIYLGQRSYGFAAASQVYFGKPLKQLTLAESALLAGLPKAPSGYNPYTNPARAEMRQHEVLRDMLRFGFIDEDKFNEAMNQKLQFKTSKLSRDLDAEYVAEMVRQLMFDQYQEGIYSSGLKIYTTIKKANQEAANNAVVQGILEYQRRQGYSGPEKNIKLSALDAATLMDDIKAALADFETFKGFQPAVVTKITPSKVDVINKAGEILEIGGAGLSLLQKKLADKDPTNDKIKAGSVVRVIKSQGIWHIVELPKVESALVALDPQTGEITALVGGFDFTKNKFNHVTQAWRQPGSSFKPFVYSAALEKGVSPATVIDDAPLSFSAGELGSQDSWEPKNFDGKYSGPIRVRTALTKSKNMVSIRILQSIGARYAQDYVTKFGFARKDHPAYLTMALGAGQTTPWQMANAYAVFANGGYRITPHLISKITDSNGKVIEQLYYPRASKDAPRVIDARNAYVMTSMMEDVVKKGTATKAKVLGRLDLAGKTGTTNNQMDAWFAGYNPKQVAVVWMGYDKPKSLGKDETGGKAALPIWIRYMETALKNMPNYGYRIPEGLMQLKVDSYSGLQVGIDDEGVYDYFYQEFPPRPFEEELPPLLDPADEAPTESNFPDSITDNPLQPQPPDAASSQSPSAKPTPEAKSAPESVDAAAKLLNPSGY